MSRDLALRRIHPGAVPDALEKARVYRLLNEPEQAESICLDILAIQPHHQLALETLILALTDQFSRRAELVAAARTWVGQLQGEYERLYYTGLVLERDARAQLAHGPSGGSARELLLEAIDQYERAEALRPQGNDDPILRRNGCLRAMAAHGFVSLAP